MTIYIDVYYLKNIIFNYLLIYLTSLIIRKKAKMYRIFIASSLGGIYAIFALYYPSVFNSIILKIIISTSMLCISFGPKELSVMISSFFTIAYSIAGIIASMLNVDNQVIMIAFAISISVVFYLHEKSKKHNEFYEIEIQLFKEEISLIAKLDTGNELKDSLFGSPVIVVSEEKVRDKLDDELIKILNNERLEIPDRYKNKIKLISFKTISGEGIKIGIKLDSVLICTENKQLKGNAIMIISERNFKQYDALIGKSLLEGGYEYENYSFNKIKDERTL